jgi:hypothetical protein
MIKFTVGDDTYEFDDEELTIDEARLLKKNAGFGMRSWAVALQDMDPDALVGLIYLAKLRAGEAVRWQDLYKVKFREIGLTGDGAADVDPPELSTLLPTPSSTSGRTRKR